MPESVIMPKLEMDMDDAILVAWCVAEGDRVSVGDSLFEIETAKAALTVEAEVDGVLLKILTPAGETVPVTQTIAWIGQSGEAIPQADPAATTPPPASPAEESAADIAASLPHREAPHDVAINLVTEGKPPATPAAKTLAAEANINLTRVAPTGPSGEIKRRDVQAAIESVPKTSPLARMVAEAEGVDLTGIAGSGHDGKILASDLAASPCPAAKPASRESRREPLSGLRKIIAQRMTESAAIPHATVEMPVDVTDLLAYRTQLNSLSSVKLTVTDLVARAAVMALNHHPICNSSLDGNDLVYHGAVHLGVAVAADRGLLVPVAANADSLSLQELSREIRRLATGAREGKLAPSELAGSTFTISNLGMLGVSSFTPLLNPPEAAILGITAAQDYPVAAEDTIQTRQRMTLCFTIDHRILDGAVAANFLAFVRDLLEKPASLALNQNWEFAHHDCNR